MRKWKKNLLKVLAGVDKSETWLEMCQIALIEQSEGKEEERKK